LTALAPLHRQPKPWDGRWWGTQPVLAPRPKKEVEWEGTAAVVQALRDGLKDPAPEVRLAAVKGLQVAPDPQVGDQLAEMFQQTKEAATRSELLKAITACKPEAAAQFVEKILTDPNADPALVPAAITIAEKSRGMAPVLAKAASAPDAKPQLVVAALEALTRMRDRSVVDVASKLVTDGDKSVEIRRAGAEALAASRSSNAIEPLLKAYADQAIRRDVIPALANIPDVRALDAYLEGLDSKDGTLRLWDAHTGAPLAVLQSGEAAVDDVALSRDGRVATLSNNKVVQVFECKVCGSLADVRALARAHPPRQLTPDERRQLLAATTGAAR